MRGKTSKFRATLTRILVVAVLLANGLPGRVEAGDSYPRACLDARAVEDAALAFSADSSPTQWSIDKLQVAYKEFSGCVNEAADSQDLGYAVVGMIRCDVQSAAYFYTMATLAPSLDSDDKRRELFSYAKARALSSLTDAKRLIDSANRYASTAGNETMSQVDRQYEFYKKIHELLVGLTYDSALYRFKAASANDAAHGSAAAPSASPSPSPSPSP